MRLYLEVALRLLVDQLVRRKNKLLTVYYGHSPLNADDVFEQCRGYGKRLEPHVTDTSVLLHKAICRKENLLIEGAQATFCGLGLRDLSLRDLLVANGRRRGGRVGNRSQPASTVFWAFSKRTLPALV